MATRNVEDAYAKAHLELLDKLVELQSVISNQPAPDDETKINWGHVGKLAHVLTQIDSVIKTLSN